MSHDGAPTAQEPQDRRELLLEAFNKAETDAAATPAEVVKTAEPAAPAEGRARDDTGKFVAKEKDTDRFSPTFGKDKPVEAAPVIDPLAAPEPWQTAPKSWKKEYWDRWGTFNPADQRYIHEREQQMKAGIEPLLPKAELADKLTKAVEPYMNTIRGLGMELPQAVAGLMQVDNDLRTLPYEQKLQKLAQVAQSYGIDLTGQLQNAQQLYPPQYQNLQNELLTLKGQQEQFVKDQQAAQDRAALAEIEKFAKTAEHYDEVEATMTKLLQSGMAEGTGMAERLRSAYENAIRLHPEIFDKIQSAKQAAADVEKKKTADDAAKRAKAAAVSVKSATPGAAKPSKAQDRRSMLTEQFDGMSERF